MDFLMDQIKIMFLENKYRIKTVWRLFQGLEEFVFVSNYTLMYPVCGSFPLERAGTCILKDSMPSTQLWMYY